MKYASCFTGIGGFEQGFAQAGMQATALIEFNKHCQTLLRRHYPNLDLMGDICDVSGTELGRPDLVVAGFPCQDTSIAAPHRDGLDGRRSHRFFDFTRLVDEYQRVIDESGPRWVVVENPTGLLKSRGCRDMATVIRALEELGYMGAYRVVDAQHHGSPQRRGRVILVGHRGSDPRPAWQVLGDDPAGGAAARADHGGGPESRPGVGPFAGGSDLIRVWRKSARSQVALRFHDHPSCPPPGTYGKYPKHDCQGSFNPAYRETWVDDPLANTLTGFDGGLATRQTHLLAQHGRLRTLTLTEWERLQGFRDGWTEGIPESARFTALGNAMHVGSAAWLGRRISAVHQSLPSLVA